MALPLPNGFYLSMKYSIKYGKRTFLLHLPQIPPTHDSFPSSLPVITGEWATAQHDPSPALDPLQGPPAIASIGHASLVDVSSLALPTSPSPPMSHVGILLFITPLSTPWILSYPWPSDFSHCFEANHGSLFVLPLPSTPMSGSLLSQTEKRRRWTGRRMYLHKVHLLSLSPCWKLDLSQSFIFFIFFF